jgi:hypothetical protein
MQAASVLLFVYFMGVKCGMECGDLGLDMVKNLQTQHNSNGV